MGSGSHAVSSSSSETVKPSILVVDDDEQILRLLCRMLERNGYECTTAVDAEAARQALADKTFDLALCDVNLPGESGIELSRYIVSSHPDTAILFITGVDDQETAETAIEIGTYGYIIKPFNPNELIINIRNALRRRELEIANRKYRQRLEKMVADRTVKLQGVLEGIIQAMTRTVEARDPYTAGHQNRVANLAAAIAREMDFRKGRIEGIRMAGRIHDLGKISVPAEILSRPTRLTDIEFAIVKTHVQVGHEILKEIDFPWPIAEMVFEHHEKLDGSGYPRGLEDGNILLEARILCVADVVEAMSSHRPYRPALGIDVALEEIARNSGKLYDPEVAEVCRRLFRKRGFRLES